MSDDLITRQSNAPGRIYLQWCGDSDCTLSFAEHRTIAGSDGVLWCEDKINDDDVEYMRASEVERLTRERDEAVACANAMTNECRSIERERDEARAALRRYGTHTQNCNDKRWEYTETKGEFRDLGCACGLDAALCGCTVSASIQPNVETQP